MPNIHVIARVRPFTSIEEDTESTFTYSKSDKHSISIAKHCFTFDNVYASDASQEDIFFSSFNENVDKTLDGFDSAIIAYGQTAAGKSYTMIGGSTRETEGVIPRAIRRIFVCQEYLGSIDRDYGAQSELTFVEIHKEKVYDLFNHRAPLLVLSDGTPKNATPICTSTVDESLKVVNQGIKLRTTASTKMNDFSSRSHSILSIKSSNNAKLMLVDLAGSETVKKSGASGSLLQEAGSINQSLSALASVISALTSGAGETNILNDAGLNSKNTTPTSAAKAATCEATNIDTGSESQKFVPYRTSKSTQMSQSALSGQSVTTLVLNCSPSKLHEVESLNTLRFGARAKYVKTKLVDLVSRADSDFWRFWNLELERALRNWQIFGPPSASQLLDLEPVMNAITRQSKGKQYFTDIQMLANIREMSTCSLKVIKSRTQEIMETEIEKMNGDIQCARVTLNSIRGEICCLEGELLEIERAKRNEAVCEEQRGEAYYTAIMKHSINLEEEERAIANQRSQLEKELAKFESLPPSSINYAAHFGVRPDELMDFIRSKIPLDVSANVNPI